ncbi:MAG: hypothetical protein KDD60_06380, partial [Bdellovibrionales bacterium]|nr:hypothetical protein [Bdellovibrionales bacterium]
EQLSIQSSVTQITLYVPTKEKVSASHCGSLVSGSLVSGSLVSSSHSGSLSQEDPLQNTMGKELGALLDSLSTQLGPRHVHTLHTRASHFVEESFHYRTLTQQERPLLLTRSATSLSAHLVQTERPSLLFHSPHPIRAMAVLPDSPPFWLIWKNTRHHIIHGIGPERIAPKWWGDDENLLRTRDYFKVQLEEGAWVWIFRHVDTSEWFAHGIWI